jgi:hypothetical protein
MSWNINALQQEVPLVAPPGVRFPAVFCCCGLFWLHPSTSDRPNLIPGQEELYSVRWSSLAVQRQFTEDPKLSV